MSLLLCIAILAKVLQAVTISWELENYNSWNIPFAKTVEIKGRDGGRHYHELGANSYMMRIDPSISFSVLWLEPDYFTDYSDDELVDLDYTYLGVQPQLSFKGVWTDVTILIPHAANSTRNTTVDFTIFLAIGTPPDHGLDGMLSVCVTPLTWDWYQVSLMGKIEEKYSWDTIYVTYLFPRKNDHYEGFVEFASTSDGYEKRFTYGGTSLLADDLLGSAKLFDLPKVNPFLNITMPQIKFNSVHLQNNQIFVTDFKTSISMTPASAGTHLPKTIFEYMDENFFQYLCESPDNRHVLDGYNLQGNMTSYAAPLASCSCDQQNFFGMPLIGFGLQIDQYVTKYVYDMTPSMYMTLPKIDPVLKASRCSLGLWNLMQVQQRESMQQGGDIDAFAVGQNFIREFNMTFKFIKTQQDSKIIDNISLLIFLGAAKHKETAWDSLLFVIPTSLFLLSFLGYFSVLKFRRHRTESNQFEKMQKQFKSLSNEEKRRIMDAVT